MDKKNFSVSSVVIPAIVVFLNVLIIIFPKETIEASKSGLSLWFQNVLPSLLPFVIGANLLTSLGAVSFIGTLLEPLMRPVFRVSGNGGFALVIGLMSGYPMGAKVTSELREKNELSKIEAQRLISFVNNSGPLFILGAVATGMFENVMFGYYLLTAHYLSALTLGILFRFYKPESFGEISKHTNTSKKRNTFRRAYKAMIDKRHKEGKDLTLGAILGKSVFDAMETMLLVGGFIVLFCVIVKALDIIGLFGCLLSILPGAGTGTGTGNEGFIKGIFTGIIEMTNGCKNVSELGITKETAIAVAAIISWGGFSIHAQAISFISKTDISAPLYLLSKALHTVIAAIYGTILFPLFQKSIENAHTVAVSAVYSGGVFNHLLYGILYFGTALLIILAVIICGNGIILLKSLVQSDKKW